MLKRCDKLCTIWNAICWAPSSIHYLQSSRWLTHVHIYIKLAMVGRTSGIHMHTCFVCDCYCPEGLLSYSVRNAKSKYKKREYPMLYIAVT